MHVSVWLCVCVPSGDLCHIVHIIQKRPDLLLQSITLRVGMKAGIWIHVRLSNEAHQSNQNSVYLASSRIHPLVPATAWLKTKHPALFMTAIIKNTPCYRMGEIIDMEMQRHQQRQTRARTHAQSLVSQTSWGSSCGGIFLRHVQNLYATHVGHGFSFPVNMCEPALATYRRMHISYPLVHAFTLGCVSVCMCAVVHRHTVCLTRHILLSLSSALSLPPPRSARLARTCVSLDSVLCLLPRHEPTALQCSPVCINWQRDGGYVECGANGRRERGRGEVRTQ